MPKKRCQAAERIGYPVLVRPSYVLGGRSMEIVYDEETLKAFMEKALLVSPEHPILIDKFLEDAIEIDVDAISDGETTVVAGIMEHIEEAGIHSGDSACILPPMTISAPLLELIKEQTKMLAQELNVVGLMNIQYAIKDGKLVCAGSQSPRFAHHSFCQQGDRRAAGKTGHQSYAGQNFKRTGIYRSAGAQTYFSQRSCFPVQPFSRCGYSAGAGNEIHRRSYGNRPIFRSGFCQIANGGGIQNADGGDRLYQRQ